MNSNLGLLQSGLDTEVPSPEGERTWEEDLVETRRLREASNLRQVHQERELVRLKEGNDQLREELSRKNHKIAALEREKKETENRLDNQILSRSEEVKRLSVELQNFFKRNSHLNDYVLKLQNENRMLRLNEKKQLIEIEALKEERDNFSPIQTTVSQFVEDLKNENISFSEEEENVEDSEVEEEVVCYNCTGRGHFARECPSDCRKCEHKHQHPSLECFHHDPRKRPRYNSYE